VVTARVSALPRIAVGLLQGGMGKTYILAHHLFGFHRPNVQQYKQGPFSDTWWVRLAGWVAMLTYRNNEGYRTIIKRIAARQ
jgi:hypothetical protein